MRVLTISGKKWEVTGEFRQPAEGEWYLSLKSGRAHSCCGGSLSNSNILKPVKWEPKYGDRVYFVEVFNDSVSAVSFSLIWKPEYELGLIRQTQEEAEALLEKLQKVAKEFEV